MKKYNIRFKKIMENVISIPAKNKKEAMEMAKDLLRTSIIKDVEINNITKHYVILEFERKPIFK
ncbi:MAG: hypothetical protein Q4G04_06840 [bacterium]|nr:hypothetical protein [bacterium]